MSASISIKRFAEDKKAGLTVGELEVFRTDLDHAGIDAAVPLKARVGFRGQITSVEANA